MSVSCPEVNACQLSAFHSCSGEITRRRRKIMMIAMHIPKLQVFNPTHCSEAMCAHILPTTETASMPQVAQLYYSSSTAPAPATSTLCSCAARRQSRLFLNTYICTEQFLSHLLLLFLAGLLPASKVCSIQTSSIALTFQLFKLIN